MRKITYIPIALLLMLGVPSQSLTLNEALQAFRHSNPRMRELDLEVETARLGKLKELAAHLPHISLDGQHFFNEKFQVMRVDLGSSPSDFALIQPYTIYGLNASLLVFDGFSSWNRYRAAALNADAASLSAENERFRLEQNLRLHFYQALAAKELADVAEENVKALERHLRDVNNMVRSGVATRFDTLKTETQLEDAKTELLAAQDDVELSRAKVLRDLDMENSTAPLEGTIPVVTDEQLTRVSRLKPHRKDEQALKLKQQSAEYLDKAALGEWLPKISLFGREEWYDNIDHDWGGQSAFKNAYYLGLKLEWNIFDGGATWASRRQAAEALAASDQKKRELDLSIPLGLEFWRRKLSHSLAVSKTARLAIKRSKESIRLAKSGLRAGVRTNTDVLDAERDFYSSKAQLVRAQLDALNSIYQLELSLGRKVFTNE